MDGRSNQVDAIDEAPPELRPVASMPSEATFGDLYREHVRDVYRYVLVSLRRPDDADDVVADTFDRAYAAWRSGHGPLGRPLPWLLVIARRIMVDRWRRQRLLAWLPLRATAGSADPIDPDSGRDRSEFWMWLEALARVLPDRQREVLFLRYQRDLSDTEVGEIVGLSPSGVRTLAARAIASLRRHPELWS